MHTQDPQEYLPFLKELRALEDWERKFRVDDHLGRYDKALRHLHTAGELSSRMPLKSGSIDRIL